ncbi:MAG: hypothetical protein QXF52_03225 [Thermoproteota archaeon]
MVLIDSIILENYLKQKSKAFLADSFIGDVFEGFGIILDRSVYLSEGNFTVLKQVLEEEAGEFMNRILETREFFNECRILLDFNYTINYTENCSVEIEVTAYVKELEEFFSFERTHRVSRTLTLRGVIE